MDFGDREYGLNLGGYRETENGVNELKGRKGSRFVGV